MTTRQNAYYERTRDGEASPLVQQAAELALATTGLHQLPNIAVDCGCGAGRHLAYLREKGFEVHGFDVEPEAMMVRGSFQERPVCVSGRCETYTYPNATLIMAFASLFFLLGREFRRSLVPNWEQRRAGRHFFRNVYGKTG